LRYDSIGIFFGYGVVLGVIVPLYSEDVILDVRGRRVGVVGRGE
jgi:hypothetical protein